MSAPSLGFLMPLPDDAWLFYAPLQQIAAIVDRRAGEVLARGEASTAEGVRVLQEALAETPALAPEERSGAPDPHFLGITTTRGCNIGCVYCNFGGPTADNTQMPAPIAMAAVDWMSDRLRANNQNLFRVHFFGGEPLVAWDLIEVVVHRVRHVCAQHGWRNYIDASTNGVMSDKRLQFVGDYFGGVVLSFDGPAEFQDRNRPTKRGGSTFAAVDHAALTWRDMPLDLCLRVCVTGHSVARMAEITEWMCERYDPTVVNFETLTPGELAARAGLAVPDPYAFARGCIAAHRVAHRFGVRAVYSAAEYRMPRRSFCPVGTDSPIVGPDGAVNACYLLDEDWRARGLDLRMGGVDGAGRISIHDEALERVRAVPRGKARCASCFCQFSCAGGCHVNQTFPEASLAYTDFCEQTRLVTACLLLEELGRADIVDALLADDAAMRRLAHHDERFMITAAHEEAAGGARAGAGRPLHEVMAVLQ